MDIEHFSSLVVGDAVEKAEERLMQTWYPCVTSLFSGEGRVAGRVSHANGFHNCVSTLISNHVSANMCECVHVCTHVCVNVCMTYIVYVELGVCVFV